MLVNLYCFEQTPTKTYSSRQDCYWFQSQIEGLELGNQYESNWNSSYFSWKFAFYTMYRTAIKSCLRLDSVYMTVTGVRTWYSIHLKCRLFVQYYLYFYEQLSEKIGVVQISWWKQIKNNNNQLSTLNIRLQSESPCYSYFHNQEFHEFIDRISLKLLLYL